MGMLLIVIIIAIVDSGFSDSLMNEIDYITDALLLFTFLFTILE
jgi:hypothetical protein